MKQYTNESQTTKLIELGFEKPKSSVECELPKGDWRIGQAGIRKAYSIGELIEMLPIELEDVGINTTLAIHFDNNIANVEYIGVLGVEYSIMKEELIEALYAMIVKLKEEKML